jgi:hypothetical protein
MTEIERIDVDRPDARCGRISRRFTFGGARDPSNHLPKQRDSGRGPSRIGSVIAITIAVLALCNGNLDAQEQARYVGAAACELCHPAESDAQASSAHAHALSPAPTRPAAFPPIQELFRPPRYRFRFRFTEGAFRVVISDSSEEMDLPVDWAFGAGEQAMTFVGRLDANSYIEHYFSYYAAIRSLAPTPGHIGLPSNTLALASGLLYPSVDPVTGIIKCFECHSTGPPIVGDDNEITPAELGVRCEACHGPGSLHVEAASLGEPGKSRRFITNPGRLPGGDLNQFCGRCHRTLVPETNFEWSKPWSVRQQPVYLNRSACFLQSKGALSCLTCHSPHQALTKDSGDYDRICSKCHESRTHPTVSGKAEATCVGCHMPRVSPQENLAFTNHWIGVYGEDDKLRPMR